MDNSDSNINWDELPGWNSPEETSELSNFAEAEMEFAKLKDRFEAGGLSEEDFKARLQKLMVQDTQGRWWVIGYETGNWYVWIGEEWVQRRPPQDTQPEISTQEVSTVAASLWTTVWWPAVLIAIGVGFSRTLFPDLCAFVYNYLTASVLSLFVTNAIFGAAGGLLTGMFIRMFYPSLQSKYLYAIALGWAAVFALFDLNRDTYNVYLRHNREVYLIFFSLAGAGLVLALVLRKAELVAGRKDVLLITLAWSAVGLIRWLWWWGLGDYTDDAGLCTLAGFIGGAATFNALRSNNEKASVKSKPAKTLLDLLTFRRH